MKNSCIFGVAALLSFVASALPSDPLGLPTSVQTVVAEFESETAAKASEMKVMPLPYGRKAAFASRWDDSSYAHPARAEMFARLGWRATFFLNGGEKFMADAGKRLLSLGSRLGNHTTSHPFLMQSSANVMFSEVLANRVEIESVCDTTVTSFVIPFNWGSTVDPERQKQLAKILVDTGHFVSSDWPIDGVGQGPERWMPGMTFGSDDVNPSESAFEKAFAQNKAAALAKPDYPKLTYGIHSWCKPEGLAKQEGFLKRHIDDPELWFTDDSEYGAYRYGYYHSRVRKIGVEGKSAEFEIVRFKSFALGADVPLCVDFGSAPVKVTCDGGEVRALGGTWPLVSSPSAGMLTTKVATAAADGSIDEFPGVKMTIAADEKAAKAVVTFSGAGTSDFLTTVMAPPLWANGRQTAAVAGGTFALGIRSGDPDCSDGDRLYAASVDFVMNGERCRAWAMTKVRGERSADGGTPRDSTLVFGPIKAADFKEDEVLRLSQSGIVLPNRGRALNEFWRSMSDPSRAGFSAAAYMPWGPTCDDTYNKLAQAADVKKDVWLAAVDFTCEEDGEKLLTTDAGKWELETWYLNGVKYSEKGSRHRMPVKKGLNRLILRWRFGPPWQPQALLYTVGDDVRHPVRFSVPPSQDHDWEFASDGFSVVFGDNGSFRSVTLGGEKLFTGGCASKDPVVFEKSEKSVSAIGAGVRTTVTADEVVISGEGPSRFDLFLPVERMVGRTLKSVSPTGSVRTLELGPQFAKGSDFFGCAEFTVSGLFGLKGENCGVLQTFDRRQWNQPVYSLKIEAKEGKWDLRVVRHR